MDDTDPDSIDFGKFGFGKERTLEDYERYAGIKFDRRGVMEYTWPERQEPPTPNYVDNPDIYPTKEDWLDSFGRNWCVDIWISGEQIKTPEHEDCDFWAVTAHDKDGEEIYREDLNEWRLNEEKAKDNASFFLKFCSDKEPRSWAVLPHSKSKGWLERIGPNELRTPRSKYEIENGIFDNE